jgi:diguanylate cyclase (GGDEF)-like protein
MGRNCLRVLVVTLRGEPGALGEVFHAAGLEVSVCPPGALEAPTGLCAVLVLEDAASAIGELVKAFDTVPIILRGFAPPEDVPPDAILERLPEGPLESLPQQIRFICQRWCRIAVLKRQAAMLHDLEQAAELAYFEYQPRSGEIRCSDAFIDLLGTALRGEEPSLGDLLACIHPDDQDAFTREMERTCRHALPFHSEFRLLTGSGDIRFLQVRGVWPPRATGLGPLFCVVTDVTAHEERIQRAERRSLLDPLTGLGNRVLLERQVQELMRETSQAGTSLALMCIDLDGFKLLNDSLGHEIGDLLLMTASSRMVDTLRASDLVCRDASASESAVVSRVGGDEFTILVPALSGPATATAIAERIRSALARPIDVAGHRLSLRASVGIAMFPEDGRELRDLSHRADLALYDAKRSGRSQCRLYSPVLEARNRRRIVMESRLCKAIEAEAFELQFQPRIDVARQQIVGIEALLRWTDPELGSVSPLDIVRVASEAGVMPQVGAWVLRAACHTVAAVPTRPSRELLLMVNLCLAELEDPNLAQAVADSLRGAGLAAERLELDVTESALAADSEVVDQNLHELAAMGVRIALDDFGAGQSALKHLVSHPLNAVKLAGELTEQIGRSPRAERITANVVRMLLELELTPVAESVSSDAQLDFYRAHGCVEMQGRRFSPPLSRAELARLLAFSRFTAAEAREIDVACEPSACAEAGE